MNCLQVYPSTIRSSCVIRRHHVHYSIAACRIFGFSLVELLVVVAIIALLLALLIPSLAKAQMQAKSVNCRSNLRQNYGFLIMYARDNRGIIFPTGRGDDFPPDKRWPCFVF